MFPLSTPLRLQHLLLWFHGAHPSTGVPFPPRVAGTLACCEGTGEGLGADHRVERRGVAISRGGLGMEKLCGPARNIFPVL